MHATRHRGADVPHDRARLRHSGRGRHGQVLQSDLPHDLWRGLGQYAGAAAAGHRPCPEGVEANRSYGPKGTAVPSPPMKSVPCPAPRMHLRGAEAERRSQPFENGCRWLGKRLGAKILRLRTVDAPLGANRSGGGGTGGGGGGAAGPCLCM